MQQELHKDARTVTVSVIIPVWRPDPEAFEKLLSRLMRQTYPPDQIRVVNTLEEEVSLPVKALPREGLSTEKLKQLIKENGEGVLPSSVRLLEKLEQRISILEAAHISKSSFDHAFTRDCEARKCGTDLLVFMTMDAVPADRYLLENLCAPFADDPRMACVYGRQLPLKNADVLERFTRQFNYPPQSRTKTKEDLPELGIKTFFCSNVCAAYRRDLYLLLGGFEGPAIFNEDMVFAGKALMEGYSVRYEADARVFHSHRYSGAAQFRRNFDIGVSQANRPQLFDRPEAASESEGIRMVMSAAKYLLRRRRPDILPRLFRISACKYAGYFLGKRYRSLPGWLTSRCSSNPEYFKK